MHPIEAKAFLQRMASEIHDGKDIDSIVSILRARRGDQMASKALEACVAFKNGQAGTRRCCKCSAQWHSLHLAMIDSGVYDIESWQNSQDTKVQGLTCNKCNESYCVKCLPTVILSADQKPLILHSRRSGPSCIGYMGDR